jgi:2-(1,2-epoxy-1,2-dihydrophenyl)acetyl-CoA isomerase
MDGDPPGLDPVTEDPADRGRPPRPVAPPKKPLADFLLEFEARLRLAPEQPATDSIAALEARAEGTRRRPRRPRRPRARSICVAGRERGATGTVETALPAILLAQMRDLETLLFAVDDRVATITLNRPDAFNALTRTLNRELKEVLDGVADDSQVGAVVITGAGRAFCSGQDLRQADESIEDPAVRVREDLNEYYAPMILAMRRLPKPIIGAINGVAAGAGMSLALATDIRVASDRASFMQAFSRVGLVPDAGSNYFLPRLVGLPRALELAWTARRVGAEEALDIGLVNSVVPADDLAAAAQELAAQLARGPALATGLTKQAMLKSMESTLPEVLALEAELQARCIVTDDFAEGVAAFLEKREPRFGQAPSRT